MLTQVEEFVWWAEGSMSPEIWLLKDTPYQLRVLGGRQHPLYITSEGPYSLHTASQ